MAEETKKELLSLGSDEYLKEAKRLFQSKPSSGEFPTEQWSMALGREVRPEEMAFLSRAGLQGLDVYEKTANDILRRVRASGVEDFTIQEARALRDQYLDPTQFNQENSTATNFSSQLDTGDLALAIEGVGRNKFEDKVGSEIDAYKNPTVTDQNRQDVTAIFQDMFGRAPTSREADYFSKELGRGTSPYELEDYLKQTTEYLEAKAAKDREAINAELLASEEEVFKKAAPQIISSYMKAGRLNSSGLDNAIAKARAELANIRQQTATGYAREDALGARNAAFQNYLRNSEPAYQQRFNVQNAGNYASFQQPYNTLERGYSLADQRRARQYEVDDYNRMQSDFMRYLDSRGGNRVGSALMGGLSGAGALSRFGPYGALAGFGIGALGGYNS